MMKFIAILAILSLSHAAVVEKDRTITQVVKLLQGMLDKSVKEGDAETKIYAKFKCYCDTSEAEKSASIKELTESIALLESDIDKIQGATGELSSECAELKASMADNKAARDAATNIRNKENKAFNAEEADLTQAISQMKQAIETLTAVGADQTKSTGADNKQFMAGHKGALVSLSSEVQSALRAASGLMTPTQQTTAAAFLQAPFTGTYTSQSAQVMGIIKSMRDTFKANLEDAITTEKNSLEAYDALMAIKNKAYKEMDASYRSKQKDLGGNDKELSTKRGQLSKANNQKTSDQEFLDALLPMCADKAAGYANRKLLRANEEAAIAEAISILNSDDAFATFAGSSATKSGATGGGLKFIQLRSVDVRSKIQDALQSAHSARISKVLATLQDNAFDTVLVEIDNMIEVIGEEGKADKKKLDWCNKERKDQKGIVSDKKKKILSLEGAIDKLEKLINDEKQGLKAQIANAEQTLVENDESQKSETKDRVEDNLSYQKDVKNLVSAEGILSKAVKVLSVYYDDLEKKLSAGEALLQKHKEDPKPPEAWKGDGDFKGQSSKGGDVITMLEFILSETVKEETNAHKDEEKAQADYEDSMQKLKKEQADTEKNLADLQDDLAKAEKDLLDSNEDLKLTTEDKEAAEAVLARIKPGCDFITTNFKERESSRATEKAALEKAVRLIKGTPAYKTAVNEATVESYGDCKAPCTKDADHVKCKSCQADVTIPAFCAGHKGTKGC